MARLEEFPSARLACIAYKARLIRSLDRKQRNRCYLCHKLMGRDRTLDHILPQSKGGTDEPENVALAHKSCNSAKGDRLPAGLAWPCRAGDGLRGGLEAIR